MLRAVEAMRDTEQHWYAVVTEEILYTEARAFVTAFDQLLIRTFREHLADFLPTRVLPVSTLPIPTDISLLFDGKFSIICELLKPGKRQRDEARGLIRTMLAMEAHLADILDIQSQTTFFKCNKNNYLFGWTIYKNYCYTQAQMPSGCSECRELGRALRLQLPRAGAADFTPEVGSDVAQFPGS